MMFTHYDIILKYSLPSTEKKVFITTKFYDRLRRFHEVYIEITHSQEVPVVTSGNSYEFKELSLRHLWL